MSESIDLLSGIATQVLDKSGIDTSVDVLSGFATQTSATSGILLQLALDSDIHFTWDIEQISVVMNSLFSTLSPEAMAVALSTPPISVAMSSLIGTMSAETISVPSQTLVTADAVRNGGGFGTGWVSGWDYTTLGGYYQGSGEGYSYYGFDGLAVPQGATIVSASIGFTAKVSHSNQDTNCIVYCEDVDSAGTIFNKTAFLAANRTSASASWIQLASSTAGNPYTSVDLSAPLQEVVNRTGWSSGNSVNFFFQDHPTTPSTQTNGECIRQMRNYTITTTLSVTYTT